MDWTEIIRWFASISAMIAATIVSLNWGRRDTGWAMVLFSLSAVAWITGAVMMRDWALGTQNVVLLGIDLLGVYRYLIREPQPGEEGAGDEGASEEAAGKKLAGASG